MMKTLFTGLLLSLCTLGAVDPALAQDGRDAGNDPLPRLQREGWAAFQEGVPPISFSMFQDLLTDKKRSPRLLPRFSF